VVIGLAAVCQGAAGRYLGTLARTIGEPELARAHLEQALGLNRAMHAHVHLAHTQLDYARVLGAGGEAERLVAEAEETAPGLGLELVIARASRLRASLHAPD
jgi:hypothetical protein